MPWNTNKQFRNKKTDIYLYWFILWYVNPSRVISCLEFKESHSLYIHIYIFYVIVWEFVFFVS